MALLKLLACGVDLRLGDIYIKGNILLFTGLHYDSVDMPRKPVGGVRHRVYPLELELYWRGKLRGTEAPLRGRERE